MSRKKKQNQPIRDVAGFVMLFVVFLTVICLFCNNNQSFGKSKALKLSKKCENFLIVAKLFFYKSLFLNKFHSFYKFGKESDGGR